MKPEAQRIALAEWAGWTHVEDKSENLMMPKGYSVVGYSPKIAIIGRKNPIPDYLSDLNSVHELENELIRGQDERLIERYIDRLDEKLGSGNKIFATAPQRCEKFYA